MDAAGFTEIHSPKLVGGESESGAGVFTTEYFGSTACLAQSPQLYKQLAVAGDLQGRTRERNSQLQRLRSRPFSTRFG